MFTPFDNALALGVRQLFDGLEQGNLKRRGRMDKQMNLQGPPRRNLTSIEGLDAVVAVEVQEFVALVETHVFYYASAGGSPDFRVFWML